MREIRKIFEFLFRSLESVTFKKLWSSEGDFSSEVFVRIAIILLAEIVLCVAEITISRYCFTEPCEILLRTKNINIPYIVLLILKTVDCVQTYCIFSMCAIFGYRASGREVRDVFK